MNKKYIVASTLALALTAAHRSEAQAPTNDTIRFAMQRSAAVGAAGCLPHASAIVTVKSVGEVEIMHVDATGLPPNVGFDLFVIQLAERTIRPVVVSGRHADQR